MQSLKKTLVAGLLASVGVIAIPTLALAGSSQPQQQGFAHGADYAMYLMEQNHDEISRMSPEDRSKLAAMQDKLMQMEMDHEAVEMKMAMEMDKAKRDLQMFIFSAQKTRDRGQATGG